MHKEILSDTQNQILPLIQKFSSDFGLVGGTAIALHLGHRRSIDFDLFTYDGFNVKKIRDIIRSGFDIEQVIVEEPYELTLVVNNVKLTFYKFPFKVDFEEKFDTVIKMPSLITLAAMKAFALGRRAKWKDYVDLYFVFENQGIDVVISKAKEMFGDEFNEKLFRAQLAYFDDIDYSDTVEYMPGFEVLDEVVKERLKSFSLEE